MGDPLLNRHLTEFVRIAKSYHIHVSLSTNLSVPMSDVFIDEIVTCGFDDIRLSIDGSTQEVYEKYRVRGSLHLVIDNLWRLVAAKMRLGLATPFLTWVFLEWPWNRHEIDDARRMAAEVGVNAFCTLRGDPWEADLQQRGRSQEDNAAGLDPTVRKRVHEQRQLRERNQHANGCDFLDHTMAINSDGTVHPCCYIVEPKNAVGHIDQDDGYSPFNSQTVLLFRQFVSDISGTSLSGPSPCVGCGALAAGHVQDSLNFEDALRILRNYRR